MGEHRLSPAEVDAYWQRHGLEWQNGRRELAKLDVVPRGQTFRTTDRHKDTPIKLERRRHDV